jgi:hypothetical protein
MTTPGRQMALVAGMDDRRFAVRNQLGHRGMLVGKPIRRIEEVIDLFFCKGLGAARHMFGLAVVRGQLEISGRDGIGPIGRRIGGDGHGGEQQQHRSAEPISHNRVSHFGARSAAALKPLLHKSPSARLSRAGGSEFSRQWRR